ncbi:hypothetical protein N7457_007984 [Penicillium paradoxum]|uniref:uncharacterized protein n=1 Tax=Penicillium paradoxum TaxID=176176 RepID=UPI002546A81F|nr:uncharacterized protein N7457_007984 [Penicillium paradoxum]KAJ5773088.1 hypothetical protein N7457_007984 [Penicillium paradoxum]
MAVTELALLRLKTQDPSPSTKSTLLQAQKLQSEYSGYQVTYLHQIEDPASFYLLGGWESIEKHTGGGQWTSSEANQKLLAQLKDSLDVSWVIHLGVDPSASQIPLDAPVLVVGRLFVEKSRKDMFEAAFQAVESDLGAQTAPFSYCGGWRIDQEGEDEEFVLFTGWKSVKDHKAFAESEASKGLLKLTELVKDAEACHAHVEKWE